MTKFWPTIWIKNLDFGQQKYFRNLQEIAKLYLRRNSIFLKRGLKMLEK